MEPNTNPRNPRGTYVEPAPGSKPRINPVVISPPRTPKPNGPLEKARKARATALKCYEKAAPTAPSRGRIAAAKLTLKYLRRAQGLYDIALKSKLSKRDRQSANAELTEVQRLMFWCHKFLPAGS